MKRNTDSTRKSGQKPVRFAPDVAGSESRKPAVARDIVEEASRDSFPASDAPAWINTTREK